MTAILIARVNDLSDALKKWIGHTLKEAERLLPKGKSRSHIARMIGGDWVTLAMGGVTSYAQWEMSIAILGPLLSLQEEPQPVRSGVLLLASIICCMVVCGVSIIDIMGLTQMTSFSQMKICRKNWFYVASTGLVLNIMVGLQLAFYHLWERHSSLWHSILGPPPSPEILQVLQVEILILILGIHILALSLCLFHIEAIFRSLVAGIVAIGVVPVGMLWCGVKTVEFFVGVCHPVLGQDKKSKMIFQNGMEKWQHQKNEENETGRTIPC